MKAGTQLLELDVHLTKDNQVVVVHDPNLSRLTGRNLDVTQLRYDELPLLQKQLAVTFSKGTHPSTWPVPFSILFQRQRVHVCVVVVGKNMEDEENRKIPLLKEVFERFPSVPVNIDIKVNDDRLITETSRLISDYKREKLTVWGNASKVITEKCYREVS